MMSLEDKQQYDELVENGTLCCECGNLVDELVGSDRILKTPSGVPTLCKECAK